MRRKLKEARTKAGMTQQQTADEVGIDERYYKAIESGERLGAIWIWDKLEALSSVHQRELRENHHGREDNPPRR